MNEKETENATSRERAPRSVSRLKRLSLRKKQTSQKSEGKNENEMKRNISTSENVAYDQDQNFNFYLNFPDNYSPGFNSSFTPVRRNSTTTPNVMER